MTKQETYDYLNACGIPYEVTEHSAVFSMAELTDVPLPYPEADAKNLFVRDDKKRNYYLITVKGDRRVNLGAFRRAYGTRPLTFASPEDLLALLKLTPGSVTPLGLLCNEEKNVIFYVEDCFFEGRGLIGCHPNDNTATVWMKTEDLCGLIRAHGNEVRTFALPEEAQ